MAEAAEETKSAESEEVVERVTMSGDLLKWTNYVRGYQQRFFVISNGFLSYYRSASDVDDGMSRGMLCLSAATVQSQDSKSFIVTNGNISYHLKASSANERDQWVQAIRAETDKYYQLSSEERKNLEATFQNLGQKYDQLLKLLATMKQKTATFHNEATSLNKMELPQKVKTKITSILDAAKVLSDTFRSVCMLTDEVLTLSRAIRNDLETANSNAKFLEEMVETLALQHRNLERKFQETLNNIRRTKTNAELGRGNPEDDEEFFDALIEPITQFTIRLPSQKKIRNSEGEKVSQDLLISRLQSPDSEDDETGNCVACVFRRRPKESAAALTFANSFSTTTTSEGRESKRMSRRSTSAAARRRSRMSRKESTIPVFNRRRMIPPRSSTSANIWAVLKSMAGSDLSRISLPVVFNEPLTFLQRLTEELEYSECLDLAARCESSLEQMSFVAAFSVSTYSATALRTTKPFNPLLGETYECDRRADLGWKSFAEQVSHHPPTAAMHTDGRDWTLWQELTVISKFKGGYIQVNPLGYCHLLFHKSGNHYTWQKVESSIHNIIVGQLWIDHHGECTITNHRAGDTCQLVFSSYSIIYKESFRKVTGIITDSQNAVRFIIQGAWDDKIERSKVVSTSQSSRGKMSFSTEPAVVIWERIDPPLNASYNFSQLAIELNEPEPSTAPTDSRLRPDLRLMEQSQTEEADKIKILLEEKQRSARRRRTQSLVVSKGLDVDQPDALSYEPKWFKKLEDPLTGSPIFRFTNEYWMCKKKQDWSRCPNIFL